MTATEPSRAVTSRPPSEYCRASQGGGSVVHPDKTPLNAAHKIKNIFTAINNVAVRLPVASGIARAFSPHFSAVRFSWVNASQCPGSSIGESEG
jgi:hypothetical protein